MPEEWRPVAGYEGQYEVSSLGRVRRLQTKVTRASGTRFLGPKILSPNRGAYGHAVICLGGRNGQNCLVHRLVYSAFVGSIPDGAVVRHLDGDPTNNDPKNLALGNQSDNQRDIYEYGGRHGNGKLYREDVIAIREALARGELQKDIAAKYGVSAHAVSNIKTGKTFSYIK